MYIVEIALLLVGVLLLVSGYRKNQRHVLVVAAVTLFLSGAIGQFTDGIMQGYHDSSTAAAKGR